MKKITLLTAFLMCYGISHAQTEKGKVLLGVSTSLNVTSNTPGLMNFGVASINYKSDAPGFQEADPDKITSFNLSPKVGYFLIDNLALGLDINLGFSSQKTGFDGDKYNQTILGAGPFVRYYIPTPKVLPFFEINSFFGSSKTKIDFKDNTFWDDMEVSESIVSFGGGAGIAAPLGERVMLDVMAGYSLTTVKEKEDNPDNDRIVMRSFAVELGFTVMLGGNSAD